MKREIINKLRNVKHFLLDKNRHEYIKTREIVEYAPYKVGIYENMLSQLKNDEDIYIHDFVSGKPKEDKINFFLRHDIDTKGCIENMSLLLDLNKKYNIHSGVYFRVDDDEYRLGDYREVVNKCKNQGFEVGLHTVCYVKDDFMKEFVRETEKFIDETGIIPESFTVHGLGEFRVETRKIFYEEIAKRINEFGYTFTDCHKKFRKYDYVIQDCNLIVEKQQRYIFDDFINRPPFFKKGGEYLILTHPCYWI
jgi:hypothetical protein